MEEKYNLITEGFFVLQPEVLDYISGDGIPWTGELLEDFARQGKLYFCRHEGVGPAVDTLWEKSFQEAL